MEKGGKRRVFPLADRTDANRRIREDAHPITPGPVVSSRDACSLTSGGCRRAPQRNDGRKMILQNGDDDPSL